MPSKVISLNYPIPSEATCVAKGKFFEIYQWPQKLYDGSTAIFERVKRPDTASMIVITPDKKFLVTEQEQPSHKPFWGLLGGVVDPGEQPEEAVKRELLEESGYQAKHWKKWFALQPSSRIEWTIHTFVGFDVEKIQEPHTEPGEKIVIHALTFEEFVELVQQDDFRDQEVCLELLKAKVNPAKMAELQQLFFE